MKAERIDLTIGQVADYVDLPQSVLRYWETVFDRLNPKKTEGGSRRYNAEDIEIIIQIKELLYEKGFTIKGANKYLISQNSIPETKITDNVEHDLPINMPQQLKETTGIKPSNDINELKDQIINEIKEILLILEE